MRGDLLSLISFMSNFHKNALSFYIVLLRIFCFFYGTFAEALRDSCAVYNRVA